MYAAAMLSKHMLQNMTVGHLTRSFCITQTVTLAFDGLPYHVSGRNDNLVSLRRFHNDPLHGGVLGVELKKKLAWASVRQAKTEYMLFATKSWYPFCQVSC